MDNHNAALAVLKTLKQSADETGRVEIDLSEICRAMTMSSDDVQECLQDLEYEGFLRMELACVIAKEWL